LGAGALLVGAGWLKAGDWPPVSSGLDGAYYFQVARQVATGQGLATSVSVFHHGLAHLPHANSGYPLWPLVLGAVGALTDLELATRLLVKALYLLDILALYALVYRVSARRFDGWRPLLMATLAGGMLALNPVFFWATSRPYTESIGLLWTLGAIWATDAAAQCGADRLPGAVTRALLAGLLAGCAYATRFQAVGVSVAVVGWLALGAREHWRRCATWAAAAGALVPMALVAFRLARFPGFDPVMLIDWGVYRQLDALPPFETMVTAGSLAGWLMDRLSGVVVAFDPRSPESYYASFGAAGYLVLLAAGGVFWRGPRRALASVTSAHQAAVGVAVVTGVVELLPVHMTHALPGWWGAWFFGWRQGLPLLCLIVPSLGWLMGATSRAWRLSAVILGVAALGHGGTRIAQQLRHPDTELPGLAQAAIWLDSRPERVNALSIEPQRLAVYARTGLYWVGCSTPRAAVRTMLERLPIRYVLLRQYEQSCPAFADAWPLVAPAVTLGTGPAAYTVFEVKRGRSPAVGQ
jgi:hypothetical protein